MRRTEINFLLLSSVRRTENSNDLLSYFTITIYILLLPYYYYLHNISHFNSSHELLKEIPKLAKKGRYSATPQLPFSGPLPLCDSRVIFLIIHEKVKQNIIIFSMFAVKNMSMGLLKYIYIYPVWLQWYRDSTQNVNVLFSMAIYQYRCCIVSLRPCRVYIYQKCPQCVF